MDSLGGQRAMEVTLSGTTANADVAARISVDSSARCAGIGGDCGPAASGRFSDMRSDLFSKFKAVVALMDGSPYLQERITAREKAERIADDLNLPFAAALLLIPRRSFQLLPPTRAEAEAEIVASRAAKEAEEDDKRGREAALAEVAARYGSLEKAEAPCWRESALLYAAARWRITYPSPEDRWTASLAGCHFEHELPDDVRMALRRAVPWPATFTEAQSEIDYWKFRADEFAILFDRDDRIDAIEMLDLVAQMRMNMVYKLMTGHLQVCSAGDLELMINVIKELGEPDDKEWDAVREAVRSLAASERASIAAGASTNMADRVRSELHRDEKRSDRAIARLLGCSPTTVGKVRRIMAEERARAKG